MPDSEFPHLRGGMGGIFQQLLGSPIASQATINVTHVIHRVTGAETITRINPPWDDWVGPIWLLNAGGWTWSTGGNILTAPVGDEAPSYGFAYVFIYERSIGYWWPLDVGKHYGAPP